MSRGGLSRVVLGAAVAASLLIAAPSAGAGPAPRPAATRYDALDASLAGVLLAHGNLSASFAITRDGRTIHTASFGLADPFAGVAATPATRYRVASVSKTFAALAIWRLATDRRLDLDAPVLPLLAPVVAGVAVHDERVRAITSRELLDQSSGLPTAWGLYFGTGGAGSCREAAVRALGGRLADDPGTSYRYSNTNYCILGLVIEALTGERFDSYVGRAVLAAFGVTDAHVALGNTDVRPGDALQPAPLDGTSLAALGAAGEWVATPSDLVRVFATLARPSCGSALPTPSVLTAPGPWVAADETDWYGRGVMVWDGGATWGHSGTIEGGRAIVEHDADGTTWAVTVSGGWPRVGEDLRAPVRDAIASLAPGGGASSLRCRPAPRLGPR